MSFFEELKRRNVFRVSVAYIVAAWVFLQVADLVLDAINAPDWVLQVLLLLAALGFIAAVIVAWAYEVTPEGIKREKDVTRDASITQQTAHKLNRLTIALVITGIAVVAVDRLIPEKGEKGSEPFSQQSAKQEGAASNGKDALTADRASDLAPLPEKSVAVLPFVNMSSDPEQEYFSDGISEEILNVLTRIPNLKVAARTSSFQFKGQTMDVAEIARQLKVNHILEGSVRKAGNQLRITAQLIEADTGYHLWSDTYDRELKDVFAIQDEIAAAIAGELRSRLAGEALTPVTPVNLDAYELYLKGRGLVAGRRENDLYEAFELLKGAIEIEPEFTSAMSTLAKAYVVAPYFSLRVPAVQMREQARDWADQALVLEPANTEALAVKAIVLNELDLDPAGALELLRQAAQANPGDLAVNNFLGDVLFRTGTIEEALVFESRAAEIDPLAPVHISDLGYVYLFQGNYDKVLELSSRALKLDPAFPHAHQGRIEAYWALGDLEQYQSATQAAIEALNANELARLDFESSADFASGSARQARGKIQTLATAVEQGRYDAVNLAFAATRIGDFDTAGEMLLRAIEEKDGTWMFPLFVRLPEQAPDSEPWQRFWSLPEPARLAEIRRANGMNPHYPSFGEGAGQ